MSDPRTQRILRQHVETDRLLGVDLVPRGVRMQPDEQPLASSDQGAEGEAPLPQAPPSPSARQPMPVDQRGHALEQMDEREVRGCTKCGLCESRTQTVFGEGSVEGSIMFVGEGPGFDEDQSGRPFVGEAGQLLDKMIRAIGYGREEVYIANLVKCRPPGNRTPTPDEVHTCWDYLRRQIEIIRPQAIVALGGPAAKMLLEVNTGITRIRGTWHTCNSVNPPVPVMPTFHPSYVMRSYTLEIRRKVWSDLQAVAEHVGDG